MAFIYLGLFSLDLVNVFSRPLDPPFFGDGNRGTLAGNAVNKLCPP